MSSPSERSLPAYQVTFQRYPRTCEIVGCVGTANWISKTTRIDRLGYMDEIATMRVCDDHRNVQNERYNDGLGEVDA